MSLKLTNTLKAGLTSLCMLAFAAGEAQAQVILSDETYAQNFDAMSGTTLPDGWRITQTSNTTVYSSAGTSVGNSATSLTQSSSGSSYKFTSSGDNAIGFLNSGGFSSPRNIFFGFTNNTSNTIDSFSLSWDYEKYRSGSRAWDWTFFYSEDGTNWIGLSTGDQSYAADAGNTTATFPPLETSKVGVSIGDLEIEVGESLYFRWQFTGNGGSSNGQAIGIDDFSMSVTTVPEPTGAALFGLAGAAMMLVRRRRPARVA